MSGASRKLVLVLITALALLWAGVGYFIWLERQRAIGMAERDVSNLALAFEEQCFWLISSVDQLLRATKAQFEADPSGFDIAPILRRQSLPPGFTVQMSVVGADGYLLSSSIGLGPDARITNYLDRVHIATHIRQDTGMLFIGPPIIGRLSGKWSLPVSLRLNKPDGSFGGVVVVAIDPFYLSVYHRRLDLGRDGVVTIIGTDGVIRARSSQVQGTSEQTGLGQSLVDSRTVEMAKNASSGVYDGVSRIDGIHRVTAFRTIRSFPLIAVVGRSLDEVLVPWREFVRRAAAAAILCSFGLFGLFHMLAVEARRRIAQARDLSEANRLLRLAEQVAMIGHWRLTIATGQLTWSDEVYRIHGLSKDQFTPTRDNALTTYHPDDRDRIRDLVRSAINVGVSYEITVRVVRPDGEIRHVVTRGLVENGTDGAPVALFGAMSDVTDRTLQEKALLQAQRDAEAAAQAKSDFLATVSHELRTPLNAVIGFADLLLSSDPPEAERRRYIRLQAEAGRTLLAVINDVLDFSKIDAGHLQLDPIPSDTVGLLQTCVELVRPMAEEKGLNLRVDLSPELPAWLMLDPNRVRQVVLNLLNNATKFTQAGYVALTARPLYGGAEGDMLRISVEDTGIGIAPDRQLRLFEPFHQADTSTARRYGGTGLGLAICKRLVGMMGGRVGVSSDPGRGSLFWVEIPLLPTAPPLHAPALPTPGGGEASVPSRSLHVLVAEDLPVNQLLVRAILERAGHRVETAPDGHSALDAVQRHAFDLVLMDVQMPGMDGLEATRAIRALPSAVGRIPIIALTANALASEVERCRQAGMNDHISKPIDAEHLVATLVRWSQRIGPRTDVPAALGTVKSSPPVLEAEMLAQLETLMGRGPLLTMLAEVGSTLRSRLGLLLVSDADMAMLRSQSHAMISLAGNFGLMEMSAAARVLEQTIDGQSDHKAALAALVEAADRGLAALDALLANSVAAGESVA